MAGAEEVGVAAAVVAAEAFQAAAVVSVVAEREDAGK